MDGGIFLNSPAQVALLDIVSRFPNEDIQILSIGTGSSPYSLKADKIKNWGILPWIVNQDIFKIMMDAVQQHSIHSVSKALNNKYLRIDPGLKPAFCTLDTFSPAHRQHWESEIFTQFFGDRARRMELRKFFGLA